MVVGAEDDEEADRVFAALADRTRRDIVTRVLREEASVSSLARRYAMSFAAVQKHVAVLERAGLVRKERRGREQIVRGDVDTVRSAARLLDHYEELWRGRLGRMEDLLAEPDLREPGPTGPHPTDPHPAEPDAAEPDPTDPNPAPPTEE